jgi:hypothetical protein
MFGLVEVLRHDFGDAEVENFYDRGCMFSLLYEDVCGFEVPVDYSCFVRDSYRGRHLQHEGYGSGRLERGVSRKQFSERSPFQQLHYEINVTVISRAKVGDRDGIYVLQPAGGLCFPLKPDSCRFVFDQAGMHYFDCYGAVDKEVRRPVNRAHAALPNHFFEAIFGVKYFSDQWVGRDLKCYCSFCM